MNITKVGIGVVVFRNGYQEVLVGKRKGSHGEGEWALPGGHLEYMESFFSTAVRELAEEVGPNFIVRNLRVVSLINLIEYAPKHYIDIGMACEWISGDPVVMEPHKVDTWEWVSVNDIPTPRFATVERIVEAGRADYLHGVSVFDSQPRMV